MPAAVGAGAPFLAACWLFAFSPTTRGAGPTALELIAVVCCVLAAISIFGIVPAIVLFNRPKCLVPPNLRDQPGYIDDRRARTGPAR